MITMHVSTVPKGNSEIITQNNKIYPFFIYSK